MVYGKYMVDISIVMDIHGMIMAPTSMVLGMVCSSYPAIIYVYEKPTIILFIWLNYNDSQAPKKIKQTKKFGYLGMISCNLL